MVNDVIIIGGGLSGLSALNRFVDLGINAVLIEQGTYPMHRICGEFYSPECVELLQNWGVNFPITMSKARFVSGNYKTDFDLPYEAFGISRYKCENYLVERAKKLGATIIHARVNDMQHDDLYTLKLSSGEILKSKKTVVATGRHSIFAQKHWAPVARGVMPFIGIKAHFENVTLNDYVQVHVFPGAYLGVSPIEDGKVNVGCLAKMKTVQALGGPEKFMNHILSSDYDKELKKLFANAVNVFPRFLTCGIPKFGKRKLPDMKDAYFVGDTIGAIAPVCGDGMAMGITSGIMAANFAAKDDYNGYVKAWHKRYTKRLHFGEFIQSTLFRTNMSKAFIKVCNIFPSLPKTMFNLTRDPLNSF